MKPALKSVPDPIPLRTTEVLTQALAECERSLAWQQRERNTARADLQVILTTPAPDQLAQAREQRGVSVQLDEQIGLLEAQRKVLQSELVAAKERDVIAARRLKQRDCEGIAKEMRATVLQIQQEVDELANFCMEVFPRLDERFCFGLPELPRGQVMVQFSRDLPSLIYRRFQALIAGNRNVGGTLQSGHELLQSGRVDIPQHLAMYLQVGMSAFEHDESPQPPRAA